MLDCEHFFDGYKANPDYALSCIQAACDWRRAWIVLCDTNGGTLPEDVHDHRPGVVKTDIARASRGHPCP